MYEVSGAATILALFALVVLRRLKGQTWQLIPRRVVVVLKDDGRARQTVVERLVAAGVTVIDEDYDLSVRRGRSRLVLDVRLLAATELERMVGLLATMPEVRRVKIQKPAG